MEPTVETNGWQETISGIRYSELLHDGLSLGESVFLNFEFKMLHSNYLSYCLEAAPSTEFLTFCVSRVRTVVNFASRVPCVGCVLGDQREVRTVEYKEACRI